MLSSTPCLFLFNMSICLFQTKHFIFCIIFFSTFLPFQFFCHLSSRNERFALNLKCWRAFHNFHFGSKMHSSLWILSIIKAQVSSEVFNHELIVWLTATATSWLTCYKNKVSLMLVGAQTANNLAESTFNPRSEKQRKNLSRGEEKAKWGDFKSS